MPAERPLKRRAPPNADPSFQLTFASPSSLPSDLPSAPSAQNALALQTTISFAPNVTPGTYTAPPPSDDLLLALDARSSRTALFPDASGNEGMLKNPPAAKRRRKTTSASASRATPVPSKASSKKSSKSPSSFQSCSPPPISSKSPLSLTTSSNDTPAHIPRPPNAFILFRSSFIRSQHVSAETEGNHGTLSKIVGMLWHALSYEEREVWQAKARRAYAEHKRRYPGYSFRPVKDKAATAPSFSNSSPSSSSSASVTANVATSSASKAEREGTPTSSSEVPAPAPAPKRKTRTVGPRDLQRCEHIAALLASGLKGAALDAAMKQFDASRAPQTFTPRFEVPLTAQAYAPPKEKGTKEKEAKKEVEELKTEKEERREEGGEKMIEPMVQAQPRPQTVTQAQFQTPAALALLRPQRVRRSSSAPLLDAGLPISAPAPLYPAPHAHFFHPQPQPQPFQFGQLQQENDGVFQFGLSDQQEQDEQQAYAASFAYPQPHTMHMQDGMALRKRSASSSPPLRRPSYSFAYSQANSQLFSHHFSASYANQQQQQEPQPRMHAYSNAHPHLRQIQAQMQAQAEASSQQEGQSTDFGLGLEFEQVDRQSSYSEFGRQQTGGLSSQSTLTDLASEEGSSGASASGNGYWNESVDFSGFSFASTNGRDSQTPISAHPTNPSPFEAPPLSAVPSSVGVEELEYDYSSMPMLVEPPLYQNYYQPARTHHPQLEIQTSWSGEEYRFEHTPTSAASVPPSSALEMESVPPSAVSGVFDFPPSSLDLESGYLDYPTSSQSSIATVPTPCSPTSQSASGAPSSAGARTPIDEAFGSWEQCASAGVASVSPVNGFDGCNSGSPEEQTMAHARALALQAGFRSYLMQTWCVN